MTTSLRLSPFRQCLNILALLAFTMGTTNAARAETFESWVQNQTTQSRLKLLQNISPAGAAHGAVSAAAPKFAPYFSDWVRDSALVMNVITGLYEKSTVSADQAAYFGILNDYVNFSRGNQLTPNRSGNPGDYGLGEPKFNMDGSAYDHEWNRPQNDGPGLRAITLIHFAYTLLARGQQAYVSQHLYSDALPASTVIKSDLEYVSHHWQDASFDLWEEVRGDHFYTRMVQRRALVEGALFAHLMGDENAAKFYDTQASAMTQSLENFWIGSSNTLVTTLNRVGGLDYKSSNLDGSAILAVLHAEGTDGFLSATNDRVMATVDRLQTAFKQIYAVNSLTKDHFGETMGVGIGRYPEDKYNGYDSAGDGNPWFLITDGLAEYYYKAAKGLIAQGAIEVNAINASFLRSLPGVVAAKLKVGMVVKAGDALFAQLAASLRLAGDQALRRVRYHSGADYSISEQFNRVSGYMQGADDLTWSHASFITAASARR